MKFVKTLIKTVLVIVVLLVVALLALPLWFGPVARGVANAAVPKVTQTGFNLAHLSLNPYTARFELGFEPFGAIGQPLRGQVVDAVSPADDVVVCFELVDARHPFRVDWQMVDFMPCSVAVRRRAETDVIIFVHAVFLLF